MTIILWRNRTSQLKHKVRYAQPSPEQFRTIWRDQWRARPTASAILCTQGVFLVRFLQLALIDPEQVTSPYARRTYPLLELPVAGKLLRLGDLRRRHLGSYQVTHLDRSITILGREPRRSNAQPLVSLDIVKRHAMAVCIHGSEIVLSAGDALVGRLAVPLCRFDIVLWNPLGRVVNVSEPELGERIALLCKWSQELDRGRVVAALMR